MSTVVATKANGYAGASFPNEGSLLLQRKGQAVGVGAGIVALHGRGGSCLQYQPHSARDFTPGYAAMILAREGFRVMAIDDMGATDWGSQDSTSRINDAIAWLQDPALGGAKTGKVGIMGWSMGGIACLNWLDQNIAKHACSWLWCPGTDLEWFHDSATYTAEIDAAYATEGNRNGNNPIVQASNYRGVGPIHIVHASDDATIPLSQSQAFVTAVNDPLVTLEVVPVGGHTALFGHPTDLEMVKHFKDAL